jgi:hypothetical protein
MAFTARQKRTIRRTVKLVGMKDSRQPEVKGLIHAAKVIPQKNFPETWRFYAVFDRSRIRLGEVFGQMQKLIWPHGLNLQPESYSPTGRFFSCRARVRIFRERIVVTQKQGIDC